MFRVTGKGRIFQFLHDLALSPPLVKSRREVTGVRQAERVSERASQRESLSHARGRARGITQHPERQGGVGRARYPWVLPEPKRGRSIGTVLFRIVQLDPPLQMGQRGVELARVEGHDA